MGQPRTFVREYRKPREKSVYCSSRRPAGPPAIPVEMPPLPKTRRCRAPLICTKQPPHQHCMHPPVFERIVNSFNLLWEYSIEYGNTQLSGPIREAGVAELSRPASAPSLSGSGATRGHRSLGRQCPSAPPAALQSDNFRPPPEMLEMWRQKRRQRKIEQPPGKSGKVG